MIVLADPDQRFQSRVADQIGRTDRLVILDDTKQIDGYLKDKAGKVEVLILGPNLELEEAFGVARMVEGSVSDVSVILVTHALTADVFQGAIRSGVRDVLPAAFTGAQMLEAIERSEQRATQIRGAMGAAHAAAPSIKRPDHRVVTVFSSKGGCGKSFLSSNLAVALARKTGKEVAIVDLDLQFGDQAIMMQLFPARTILDAAQNLDRLDSEAIRGYMTPHRSGVYLLAAPLEPGMSETIEADAVGKVIRLLEESFDFVVIDSPPSFSDHVLAALDESDECILITSMDVPSIKNMKLSLQTLSLLGFGRDRIRLVLNRADSKVGLTVQVVEKTLGTTVDVSIPSSRDVSVSINRGSPLVLDNPRSPVVPSIDKLLEIVSSAVGDVGESPAPAPDKGGKGLRLPFRRGKSLGGSESS